MTLPPEYWKLAIPQLVPLMVAVIRGEGVCWFDATRPYSTKIFHAVEEEMTDHGLIMLRFPPDWEAVIIDIDVWPKHEPLWKHARDRAELRERGVPDHELPIAPKVKPARQSCHRQA